MNECVFRDDGKKCHLLSLVYILTVIEEAVDLNLAMSCRAGEGGGLQKLIHQSGIDTCASTVPLR